MEAVNRQKYLYVVFSATPYTIGKIIRRVTKNQYNHTSITLDESLESLYSFARYYENTPLYGGFVQESLLRFQCKSCDSYIRVCAVPLTDRQYSQVSDQLNRLTVNHDRYIYNLFSAIGTLFKKNVRIDNSYTCIEFVYSILNSIGIYTSGEKFITFDAMEAALYDYIIYEGPSQYYHVASTWGDDRFAEHQPRWRYLRMTTASVNSLWHRYWSERRMKL